MAEQEGLPAYWVDELTEKHECGPYGSYDDPERIELDLGGRRLTLISPFELEASHVETATFSDSGDLLYLVARVPEAWNDHPDSGLLIVARRRANAEFAVVVWHTLFSWAFKYLGLDNGPPGA